MQKPKRTWLLWVKAKSLGVTPSSILGIEQGTYPAYCLDEAVIFFGLTLESMLEKAGQKPSKEERRVMRARESLLEKVLGDDDEPKKNKGFADPALMM